MISYYSIAGISSPCLLPPSLFVQASNHAPDFTVTILACGPLPDNGMVYAVAVAQPVQSWTVLRSHADFATLATALQASHADFPKCPSLTVEDPSDTASIVSVRNALQSWLDTVLMVPSAQASPEVRNFLTLGANTILPQYEGVTWTQFNTMAPAAHSPAATAAAAAAAAAAASAPGGNGPVDDMEMEYMFMGDDDGNAGPPHPEDHDDDDEDFIPAASERYKKTDEAVTEDDELDILQGDVEMIDDIGSLAQSLGASHLGRSLNLQAEMKNRAAGGNNLKAPPPPQQQQGLTIGNNAMAQQQQQQQQVAAGGIGGALAARGTGGADNFNRRPLESAPRLDSFKMIRVIGKGSFGTYETLLLCGHISEFYDMLVF